MSSVLPDPASKPERQTALRRMLQGIDFEPLYEVWRASEGGIAGELETGILAVLYEVCAEQAVRRGEVFMAEELAGSGQRRAAEAGFDQTRCYQLQARALARSGAVSRAAEIQMRLAKVTEDAESKGLLAGRYRDFAFEEPVREKRKKLFEEALFHARTSFKDHPESYYNGIQAAQFAFFAGELEEANNHLRNVEALCDRLGEKVGPSESQEPFWLNVTLAEAALIRGDLEKASRRYSAMVEEEETWPSDTEATRKVALELIRHHGGDARFDPILAILKHRPVAVFSGHLFDCGTEQPRLPVGCETTIEKALDRTFAELRPVSAYCSLSLGTDLLFAEAAVRFYLEEAAQRKRLALERNSSDSPGPLPVHLVVAFDLDKTYADFEKTATMLARELAVPDAAECAKNWTDRLMKLLKAVPRSRIHEVGYPANAEISQAYAHTNDLMTGMAYLKARELGAEVVPIVVHDGNGGELGGVGNFVQALRPGSRERDSQSLRESGARTMSESIHTRFFLFADVKNFSRIPDRCMEQFVEGFLGGVTALFHDPESRLSAPIYANTWGDAFLFVYDTALAAGDAALGIRDWLRLNPFRSEGMAVPLGLRIGMHAGPVFEGYDPVSHRPIYLGSHINRAARIEPITEEGQIYVSREFAALAEMEGVATFRCIPQGLADLPKGAGRIPVYRLERTSPPPNRPETSPNGPIDP